MSVLRNYEILYDCGYSAMSQLLNVKIEYQSCDELAAIEVEIYSLPHAKFVHFCTRNLCGSY